MRDAAAGEAGRGRTARRWFGVAFGLLLGLAAVCHGCHVGDHDDELSAQGAPRVRQGEKQEMQPASGGRQPPDAAQPSGG